MSGDLKKYAQINRAASRINDAFMKEASGDTVRSAAAQMHYARQARVVGRAYDMLGMGHEANEAHAMARSWGSDAHAMLSRGAAAHTEWADAHPSKMAHKEAGEAHLHAAEAADLAGDKAAAEAHTERASAHAQSAGSAWDESKHPRGDNGKFA